MCSGLQLISDLLKFIFYFNVSEYLNICSQILSVFSEQSIRKMKSAPMNVTFFEHHGAYYSGYAFHWDDSESDTSCIFLILCSLNTDNICEQMFRYSDTLKKKKSNKSEINCGPPHILHNGFCDFK